MQTFRSGGKGGQNQNKRDTGVRFIDKITGLSAESRDQRSQDQNRKTAFIKLAWEIIAHYQGEERKTIVDEGKL